MTHHTANKRYAITLLVMLFALVQGAWGEATQLKVRYNDTSTGNPVTVDKTNTITVKPGTQLMVAVDEGTGYYNNIYAANQTNYTLNCSLNDAMVTGQYLFTTDTQGGTTENGWGTGRTQLASSGYLTVGNVEETFSVTLTLVPKDETAYTGTTVTYQIKVVKGQYDGKFTAADGTTPTTTDPLAFNIAYNDRTNGFTNPTLSVTENEKAVSTYTVAYSITSNGTGITVDASTGAVTIGTDCLPGTETVTATITPTPSDASKYKTSTVSYTITIDRVATTLVVKNNRGTISDKNYSIEAKNGDTVDAPVASTVNDETVSGNATTDYAITYSIGDNTATTDTKATDATTGSTVDNNGALTIGNTAAGSFKVTIAATPKGDKASTYETATFTYIVNVYKVTTEAMLEQSGTPLASGDTIAVDLNDLTSFVSPTVKVYTVTTKADGTSTEVEATGYSVSYAIGGDNTTGGSIDKNDGAITGITSNGTFTVTATVSDITLDNSSTITYVIAVSKYTVKLMRGSEEMAKSGDSYSVDANCLTSFTKPTVVVTRSNTKDTNVKNTATFAIDGATADTDGTTKDATTGSSVTKDGTFTIGNKKAGDFKVNVSITADGKAFTQSFTVNVSKVTFTAELAANGGISATGPYTLVAGDEFAGPSVIVKQVLTPASGTATTTTASTSDYSTYYYIGDGTSTTDETTKSTINNGTGVLSIGSSAAKGATFKVTINVKPWNSNITAPDQLSYTVNIGEKASVTNVAVGSYNTDDVTTGITSETKDNVTTFTTSLASGTKFTPNPTGITRSDYVITYAIEDGTLEGTTYTDKTTGSTINTSTGQITLGANAGMFTVDIKLKPNALGVMALTPTGDGSTIISYNVQVDRITYEASLVMGSTAPNIVNNVWTYYVAKSTTSFGEPTVSVAEVTDHGSSKESKTLIATTDYSLVYSITPSTASSKIDASTGKVTVGSATEDFTVNIDVTMAGDYAGKTVNDPSYTVHVTDLVAVKLTFNETDDTKNAIVKQDRYVRPSMSLKTASGTNARQYYRSPTYSIIGAVTLQNNAGTDSLDNDGNAILKDPVTNTIINSHTGQITIGDKIGEVTVNVVFVPTAAYESRYTNPVTGSFKINISAPSKYTISFSTNNSDTIKLVNRVAKNQYSASVTEGTTLNPVTLGKPVVTYTDNENRTIDVTKYFDVTYSMNKDSIVLVPSTSPITESVTVKSTAKGAHNKDNDPLTLTFSARVKADYVDTYGTETDGTGKKADDRSIFVRVQRLSSTDRIQTYLVFDKPVTTKYKITIPVVSGETNQDFFYSPTFRIIDAEGNDYTSAYENVFNSDDQYQGAGTFEALNAFEEYSEDPLDYGMDFKNADNEIAIQQLYNQQFPNYRAHHTDGCRLALNSDWQTTRVGTGQAYVPDDYKVTFNFQLSEYSPYKDVLSATPAKSGYGKAQTVEGQFYDTNQKNTYSVDCGYFILRVLKRVPRISLIPDPATTPIATNYVMSSFNRYDIWGDFSNDNPKVSDITNPSDVHRLHLGYDADSTQYNDFWYTFFVPDEEAWPSGLSEADSTALVEALAYNGVVKMQVGGALLNSDRYVKNVQMSVPVYETETVTFTANNKSYTYNKYKTDASGNPIPVYLDEAKTIQKKELVTGTMYVSQREFGNDANSWKVQFHGLGHIPLSYAVIPWIKEMWDVGSVNAQMFHVVQNEKVKFILDPKSFTVSVGNTTAPPSVKIEDYYGKDLTEHYSFAWTVTKGGNHIDFNGKASTTGASTTGQTSTGKTSGTATITVKPTKIESSDWTDGGIYVGIVPESDDYTVTVRGAEGSLAKYDIIYDSLGYFVSDGSKDENGYTKPDIAKRKTSKMGKLHFIGAGDFYPGTMSDGEAPGLTITFGTGSDPDPWTVVSGWPGGGTTKTDEGTRKDGDTDKSFNFDTDAGQPLVLEAGNADFTGDSTTVQSIPQSGGFLKLQPTTNGFLTIDAYFGRKNDNVVYHLMDMNETVEDKYYTQNAERPSTGGDGYSDNTEFCGEVAYTYALLEGHTYYLWSTSRDDAVGFNIHGIHFKPGYVVMRHDTESATEAAMFQNGYSGDLPRLVSKDRSPLVDFSTTFNDEAWSKEAYLTTDATDKTHVDSILEIRNHYRFVAKGFTMGQRVRVRGKVLGKKVTYNGETRTVSRDPYIDIAVVAIPMYKVTADEAVYPGKRVTTTNFVTRMWMTWGGWTKDSEEYPYYHNNTSTDKLMVDEYGTAVSDTVGANNRTIDGFKLGVQLLDGNATDENVVSWNGYRHTTFNLPVRGSYVKFEPEESGTLMAYVIQNGMTDLSDLNPTSKIGSSNNPNNLRRRAMYIVDETGTPVSIASGTGDWGTIGTYFSENGNVNESSDDKNYMTEGLLRVRWLGKGKIKFDNGTGKTSEDGFNFSSFRSAYVIPGKYDNGTKNPDYKTDTETIRDYWEVDSTSSDDPYGKLMKVFKLSDGSFVVPTKAYVRYTFDVKAGKTYYMFLTGSKMYFCGYAFLPEGFTANSDKWPLCTDVGEEDYNILTTQGRGTVSKDIAERAALPEPTDDIYSGRTVGHTNIDLYEKNEGGAKTSIDGSNLGKDGANVEFVNVTLNRVFTPNQWTSICLPFSLSEYQVHQVFGTNAQVITFDSVMTEHDELATPEATKTQNPEYTHVEERSAHFTQHVNQLMEAGRPYFIKPTFRVAIVSGADSTWSDAGTGSNTANAVITYNDDKSKVTAITFKHVSIEAKDTMRVVCYNTATGGKPFTYTFQGIYDYQQIPWNSYVMGTKDNTNGLFKIVPTEGHTTSESLPYMKGFRAYLYPSESDGTVITDPAKIKSMWLTGAFVVGDAGNTSDIEELVAEVNSMLTVGVKGVFNLQGQMVRKDNSLDGLPHGVYIMNGKKYLVK